MAAMPKRRRMRACLARRAINELGEGATPLDYVCAWLAGGGLISTLARSLQEELQESVSRPITSMLAHALAPDASARIAAARVAALTSSAAPLRPRRQPG
jgi:hypothetical protein